MNSKDLNLIYSVYKNIRNSFYNVITNSEIIELVQLRLKNKGYNYSISELENTIFNNLHRWHFENLDLKQIINLLLEYSYNFNLEVGGETTVIIVYNMFEAHYNNNELDWIKTHEV